MAPPWRSLQKFTETDPVCPVPRPSTHPWASCSKALLSGSGMEFHLNATQILKSAESLVDAAPSLLVCLRPAEWTAVRLLLSGEHVRPCYCSFRESTFDPVTAPFGRARSTLWLLLSGGAHSTPEAPAGPQRQFAQKWGGHPSLPGPRCLPQRLVSSSFNHIGGGLGRTFQLFHTIGQDAETVELALQAQSQQQGNSDSHPAEPGCRGA